MRSYFLGFFSLAKIFVNIFLPLLRTNPTWPNIARFDRETRLFSSCLAYCEGRLYKSYIISSLSILIFPYTYHIGLALLTCYIPFLSRLSSYYTPLAII
jgi:hypothetical protein